MSYTSEVIADNPSFRWRLGEAAFPMVDDVGAKDISAGSASGVTFQVTAANNDAGDHAIGLDGSQADLISADLAFPIILDNGGPDHFTIELWIKPIALAGISIGGASFQLQINADGSAYAGVSNTSRFTLPAGTFVIGSWTHFAFTWTRLLEINGTAFVYINGAVAGSGAIDLPADFGALTIEAGSAANVDEIAIYPTALPFGRILAHWNASGAAAGGGEPAATVLYPSADNDPANYVFPPATPHWQAVRKFEQLENGPPDLSSFIANSESVPFLGYADDLQMDSPAGGSMPVSSFTVWAYMDGDGGDLNQHAYFSAYVAGGWIGDTSAGDYRIDGHGWLSVDFNGDWTADDFADFRLKFRPDSDGATQTRIYAIYVSGIFGAGGSSPTAWRPTSSPVCQWSPAFDLDEATGFDYVNENVLQPAAGDGDGLGSSAGGQDIIFGFEGSTSIGADNLTIWAYAKGGSPNDTTSLEYRIGSSGDWIMIDPAFIPDSMTLADWTWVSAALAGPFSAADINALQLRFHNGDGGIGATGLDALYLDPGISGGGIEQDIAGGAKIRFRSRRVKLAVLREIAASPTFDFDPAGSLTRAFGVSGSADIAFDSEAPSPAVTIGLEGSPALTLTPAGDLDHFQDLAGSSGITFTPFGDLAGFEMGGSADLTFAAAGDLGVDFTVGGSASISILSSAEAASEVTISGDCGINFSADGILSVARPGSRKWLYRDKVLKL